MAKKAKTDYTKDFNPNVNLMESIVEKEAPKAKTKKDKEVLSERFTARFTTQEWKYIQEKHWQTRTSVTDIIRDLVKADMENNPEIVAKIDELNG